LSNASFVTSFAHYPFPIDPLTSSKVENPHFGCFTCQVYCPFNTNGLIISQPSGASGVLAINPPFIPTYPGLK
jgi:hypothetical protein